MSSEGVSFFSESSVQLGFFVQIATLLGMLAAFAAFVYKTLTNKINKVIDEKIEPVAQSVKVIEEKLDTAASITVKEIKIKEELDRERFRNIQDSQKNMKEQLAVGVSYSEEIKKKQESQLLDMATFMARTETKIIEMEKQTYKTEQRMIELEQTVNNFKGFISYSAKYMKEHGNQDN